MFYAKSIAELSEYVNALNVTLTEAIAAAVVESKEYTDGEAAKLVDAIVAAIATSNDYTDSEIGAIPSGLQLVDRGDPSAVDYDKDDFTWNDAWHNLDLASKVPVGTVMVKIHTKSHVTSTGQKMQFRKDGNANAKNEAVANMIVTGEYIYEDVTVFCSVDRIIEYKGYNPTHISSFEFTVVGWFV